MKALVIVGNDLNENSSANLCHKAYIQGLLDNGFSVELITAGKCRETVTSGGVTEYRFPMKSLYEMIGTILKKGKSYQMINSAPKKETGVSGKRKTGLKHKIKKTIHHWYGPYEVYISWKRKAMHFRKEEKYDFIISLSFPPVSHYLADQLIKKKHVKTDRWIQIWEDPWCQDLVFLSMNDSKAVKRAKKEEKYLLKVADEVVYVSPITLASQKDLFKESSHKMRWYPVPTYYINHSEIGKNENNIYGYYGNYDTHIRNLEPFYTAAKTKEIKVNICGDSDKPFSSTDNIKVRPRIKLEELKPLEDQTDVLVFLCNLKGGQIPGKIYQYSATNKIILFILDGTQEEQKILHNYFGKYKRYIFCRNNTQDISNAIKAIENGEFGEVNNRILNDFTPERIINSITRNKKETE